MTDLRNTDSHSQQGAPGCPESDPRVFMAVERTFLAWIRTGLAMMAFGFVAARFGVFLREIAAVHPIGPEDSPRMSLWFGTTLVVLGTLVNVAAAFQHLRVMRDLNRGVARFDRPSATGLGLAFVLAVLGAVMVGYLIVLG